MAYFLVPIYLMFSLVPVWPEELEDQPFKYKIDFGIEFFPDRDATSLTYEYLLSIEKCPKEASAKHCLKLKVTHSPELEFLNPSLKDFYILRFGQIYEEIKNTDLPEMGDRSKEASEFYSSILEELNAGNTSLDKTVYLNLQKLLSKNYKTYYDLDPSTYKLSDVQEKGLQTFDEKSNNPAHLLGLTETHFKIQFESLHIGPLWAIKTAKVYISSKIFVRSQEYLKEKVLLLNQYYRSYMPLKEPLTATDLQEIVYVHEKEHASHGKNAYDEIEKTVFPKFTSMITVNVDDLKVMVKESEKNIHTIWDEHWSESEKRAQTAELQYICKKFSKIEEDKCPSIEPRM